jgi:arsenate reductase
MKATIWHNPACGTSRNTLAMLTEAGAEVTVVEYLKTPPSADKLAQLYRDAGITPQQGCGPRGRTPKNAACRRPTMRRCLPRWLLSPS